MKPLIFPYTHLPSQTTASQILSQSLMRSNIRPNLAQSLLQGPGRSKTFLGMAASSLVSRTGVSVHALTSLVMVAGKQVFYVIALRDTLSNLSTSLYTRSYNLNADGCRKGKSNNKC